jgi:glycerophosphoryl diester phosphodiesterase
MKKIILFLFISLKMTAQQFDIQGHRGCRGLMPENTIEAFLEALKYNVTTLELDVCITNDGQVIVSHEPYLNSLFCSFPDGNPVQKADEKNLNIYKMNYEEIKKFDSGIRGNSKFPEQLKMATYKPLLSEVFEKVEAHLKVNNLKPVNYNIEIKSEAVEYSISQPQVAEFSQLVYAVISKYIAPERVTLQSFDFEVLKYWHAKIQSNEYKKVKLAALVELKGVGPTFDELGFLPDIFSPYFKLLTKGKVKKCHKKGVKVVPWTVNETADMTKMKLMGTDGLISDYPNRAQKLFE